jgi:two-component system sensor histidine kinase YesM
MQVIESYSNTLRVTESNLASTLGETEMMSFTLLGFDDLYYLLDSRNVNKIDYSTKYAQFGLMVSHFLRRPAVFSINIYDKNEVILGGPDAIQDYSMPQAYVTAQDNGGKPVWSNIYNVYNISEKTTMSIITLYRAIIDPNTYKKVGTMSLSIKESVLYDIIKPLDTNEQYESFLCFRDGTIVTAKDKADIGTKLAAPVPLTYGLKPSSIYNGQLDGENFCFICRIASSDFYIVTIAKNSAVYEKSSLVQMFITGIALFVLVATIALIIQVLSHITKPIKVLRKKMHELEEGNFDVQINDISNDEIGLLAKTFNKMAQNIKNLIKNLYQVQLNERETQLNFLRQQINPHFLYNTLDSIRWSARKNSDYETAEYIESLSILLRHNFNARDRFVTVNYELEGVKNYAALQQRRFGDHFDFVLDIDPELLDCKIPNFILQPLVENTLNHGFGPGHEYCTIFISIKKQDGLLVIEVIDDGVGTDAAHVRDIINGKYVDNKIHALKNINDRIKIYYDDNYGIEFESSTEIGTCVRIRIPLCNDGEQKAI